MEIQAKNIFQTSDRYTEDLMALFQLKHELVAILGSFEDFDWVAPKEYGYCFCGYWLVKNGPNKCAFCRSPENEPINIDLGLDTLIEHNDLFRSRSKLSKERKETKLDRLFWMKGPNNG